MDSSSITAAGLPPIIQVGTAFALTRESGFDPILKDRIIDGIRHDRLEIFTNASASPTGLPFKIAQFQGTISDPPVYEHREQICDLGVLETCMKEDGSVGF